MNKFIGIGRLTADPEIRATQDGKRIARYTLAINRRNDEADFLRCVCFEGRAEFAEKYLHKGTKIAIEGSVRTGSYTNKDGQKIWTTEIAVANHEFVEARSNTPESKQAGSDGSSDISTPSSVGDGFVDVPDGFGDAPDGLPFN